MAESKRFFQVFPELKLENDLTELLSLVQIDRIAANGWRVPMDINPREYKGA